MKFFITVLILSLSILSCNDVKTANLPISEERAVKLLADIQVAEAAFQFAAKSTKDSIATIYYNEVFEMNHTSKAEFQSLLKVLVENAALSDSIYEKVLIRLSEMERGLNKVSKKKKNGIEVK